MKSVQQPNRGFSLVEVLVAISILLLVMTGPMRVLTQTTNSTTYSNQQTVAFFLAQEGLELVQLGRDNLVLGDFKDQIRGESVEPNPWQRFQVDFAACISDECGIVAVGGADADGLATTSCSSADATDCRLYLSTTTPTTRAKYSYTPGGQITPYTRTIRIGMIPNTEDPSRPRGIVATSTVTWRTGNLFTDQQVQLVTYYTNVYDTP